MVAELGSDPRTSGLWAQQASTVYVMVSIGSKITGLDKKNNIFSLKL